MCALRNAGAQEFSANCGPRQPLFDFGNGSADFVFCVPEFVLSGNTGCEAQQCCLFEADSTDFVQTIMLAASSVCAALHWEFAVFGVSLLSLSLSREPRCFSFRSIARSERDTTARRRNGGESGCTWPLRCRLFVYLQGYYLLLFFFCLFPSWLPELSRGHCRDASLETRNGGRRGGKLCRSASHYGLRRRV